MEDRESLSMSEAETWENTPAPTTNEENNPGASPYDRGNDNANRNNNSNRNSQRGNNRNNRNNNYVSNHPKDWKGETEEVGLVLGIKSEKLSNQTSVDGLLEKLEGHAKKTFDHYKDVLCLIVETEDPVAKLEKERENLVTDEQKQKIKNGDPFEQAMMKDVITRYGNRKATLDKNIGKVCEIIWGQCTTSIKTLVKGESDFNEKKKANDVKWLVEHL